VRGGLLRLRHGTSLTRDARPPYADQVRAIQVTRFGPPEVLTLATLPDPTPAPGEVRVRVHAVGVNFSDTERRRAVFDPPALPWVPGREAAGVVDLVGEGVDPALAGARVAYYSRRRGGAYAELATVAVDELLHFPDAVPFVTMAAVPVQGLTAWGLVHLVANVRAGDVVLLHAAAGGVGQLAVQLARRAGARVLGTVSTDEKAAIVRRLGAEPLRYGDDLAERVRAATGGRGADVVLDSVGLATHVASLAAVATFGQVVFFGDASGPVPPIDVEALYARSARVGAFNLAFDDAPARWAEAKRALVDLVATGALSVNVSRTLPLAAAAQAHHALESRASTGKLVLVPDDPSR
jgi:NADPH2:quinone reductase